MEVYNHHASPQSMQPQCGANTRGQQQQPQGQGHRTPALNKLRYDACTYETDLRQSVGPGHYQLGTPTPHCDPCFASDARVQLGAGSGGSVCSTVPLVDVESDLHNLDRRASRCPARQYQPSSACTLTPASECRPRALPTEDTRLSNPACTLRGTGWNRWEWLCQDPQDRALMPFDAMIDTAIVAKDNHRPHLACPIDQTLALPAAARTPAAMNLDSQPAWASACTSGSRARVGDGIGADGATPILGLRGCRETGQLVHQTQV